MDDYSTWRSLRELDEQAGLPKGSAFRAFKRCLPQLHEGRDFIVLDHQTQATLAARLHGEARLYRTSIHPVLLAPTAAETIRQALREARPSK